jgi:hypothetical protein
MSWAILYVLFLNQLMCERRMSLRAKRGNPAFTDTEDWIATSQAPRNDGLSGVASRREARNGIQA